MNAVPFPEDCQLNQELRLDNSAGVITLHRNDPSLTSLPCQARIELRSASLGEYLEKEFLVSQLDKLAPKLWLVSTPRHSHISALHHRAARGRQIILSENPQLHLVWRHDKIFIKPIPKYLVSHAFWQYLVVRPSTDNVQKAILGFMRSYSYLIKYESDFDFAQSRGLIPKMDGPVAITWEAFAKFTATFDRYHDVDVSPRYSYGELRLTRLNYCTRLFLGKLTFHHIDAQWSTYLTHLIAPLLTAFAIASIILNAMQVELAVQSVQGLENSWNAFMWTSRLFSVVILLMVGLVCGFMIGMMVFMFLHDIWFAWEILRKKNKRNSDAWERKKSGII